MAEESDDIRAFPWSQSFHPDGERSNGMSLRDYFAAAALPGLAATNGSHVQVARQAYLIADSMLKRRAGKDPS